MTELCPIQDGPALSRGKHCSAFAPSRACAGASLVEILGTIAVIGVLTTAAIPAIRSYKPDPLVTASRQLLNDLALARQRAISDHTTVFVVFVPALKNLRPALTTELPPSDLQRLLAGQYISYALYEKRGAGDQPNASIPKYITEWKTLPAGTAVAPQKFGLEPEAAARRIAPDLYSTFDYIDSGKIYFNPQNGFFPSGFSGFPCIAFDHQGRLASPWESWHGYDCVIPLTRGTITRALDSSGALAPVSATFTEDQAGSWSALYTHIVIDGPTGRARLVQQQIK